MSFAALPGGHLEWGEDVKECLKREIVEELGIEPEIGRLLYINTFFDAAKNTQPIEFFFEVKNGDKYLESEKLTRTHAHELGEIVWARPTDDVRILPRELGEDFRRGTVLADEPRYIKG